MKCLCYWFLWILSLVTVRGDDGAGFQDPLDAAPRAGWRWLREDPKGWRVHNGGLEIRLQPGNAQTVRNALVREAPDRKAGRFAVEVTLTSLSTPTEQYEQAGITWYVGGQPVFKLVHELVDGKWVIVPGFKPATESTVRLRLVVSGNSWTALYRPNAEGPYLEAATGELPATDRDEVSIQGYHGPAQTEHWVRFKDFRVLKLED